MQEESKKKDPKIPGKRKTQDGSPGRRDDKKRHRSDKKHKHEKKRKKQSKHSKHENRKREDTETEFERKIAAEIAAGEAARRSSVPMWAATGTAPISRGSSALTAPHYQHQQMQQYYPDSRGDPGNIAFGGLYRGDVPRYRRWDPSGYIYFLLRNNRDSNKEGGLGGKDNIGSELKESGSRRKRKKIKMWRRQGSSATAGVDFQSANKAQHGTGAGGDTVEVPVSSEGFLPLDPGRDGEIEELPFPETRENFQGQTSATLPDTFVANAAAPNAVAMSSEEYLLFKTREFNAATRERPENLQLWLDFAEFQQEAVVMTGGERRRGALRAAREKQIAILERGLEHHPGSDQLLLALLDAAAEICDVEEVDRRWWRVLSCYPGSCVLWKAYLARQRANFAGFLATDVATAHFQAVDAMKKEREKLQTQRGDPEMINKLERAIAEVAVAAAGFRFQTGHTEIGVAAVRAMLEFNLFSPEGWPEDALEVMFEEFWRGGGHMIGDPGAQGWGAWLDTQASTPVDLDKDAGGGWVEVQVEKKEDSLRGAEAQHAQQGGPSAVPAATLSPWEELAPAIRAKFGHSLKFEEEESEEERAEESPKAESENEEEMLARLGLDLDAALADAEQELTPPVLSYWLNIERNRDLEQWEGKRKDETAMLNEEESDFQNEENNCLENPLRWISWEDITPHLIFLSDPIAKEILLYGCLSLLGVPVPSVTPLAALQNSADEIAIAATWLGIGGPSLKTPDPAAGNLDSWAWLSGVGQERAIFNTTRQLPFWATSSERHACVVHCLRALVSGPFKQSPGIISTALEVASWSILSSLEGLRLPHDASTQHPPSDQNLPPELSTQVAPGTWIAALGFPKRDWAAGKTFAKELLEEQRDNLTLWAAFAKLEARAGRGKAARKAYSACLGNVIATYSAAGSSLLNKTTSSGVDPGALGLADLVLGWAQLEIGAAMTFESSSDHLVFGESSKLFPIPMLCVLRATPQALHGAIRPLLWLGSGGKVPLTQVESETFSREHIIEARRGYQDAVLRVMRDGAGKFGPTEAMGVAAAAAMEVLVGAVEGAGGGVGSGVGAALALYHQVLEALSSNLETIKPASKSLLYGSKGRLTAVAMVSAAVEELDIARCALAVDAAVHAVHGVPPSLARDLVLAALQKYPSSAPLLRMLRCVELSSHAVSALRRSLNTLVSSSPTAAAWLTLIGVEVGTRAPRTAIRAALQRAVTHPVGQRCPVLWRTFLRFERAVGSPEAVHRVLLRGVEACPWSKALWIDGLDMLNGYIKPRELTEFLTIMR